MLTLVPERYTAGLCMVIILLYFQSSGVACNLLSFSCPLTVTEGEVAGVKLVKAPSNSLLTVPRRWF